MIRVLKLFLILINLTICNSYSYGEVIKIKVKIQDEIITNFDIENEIKYLIFLNPKLQELEKLKLQNIAKNSLVTEIIKKKELKKFYDLNTESNLVNKIEKNLLASKNILSKDEFLKILDAKKIEYKLIRKKLYIETFWNKLVYQKYSRNIIINKNEIRKDILKKFKNKTKKYSYNLSEIVFAEKINEDLNAKIIKINKSIKEVGFENTANIFSISNTSKNGGNIGWVNELLIAKQISNGIKNLEVGQVSLPIKLQNSYIIVKINNKKEFKQQLNLEDQLERVINQETNRQLNNFSIIFYKRLKKNIEINEY